MTSNREFIKLKYRLKHARLKVMNNNDIHAKLNEITGDYTFYIVTNVCSDPTNTKILYALIHLPSTFSKTRVVEIDFDTGVHTILPKEYIGTLLTYNKGVFHGHINNCLYSTCEHVVYTGSTYKIFGMLGRGRHDHQLVGNCMVYDFDSKDIHKHVVVQLDKFTQDNVNDIDELPCTIFDLSADKQHGCSFNCKGFIPILKC